MTTTKKARHDAETVGFPALAAAEFRRARRTRSTLTLMFLAAGVAVVMQVVRLMVGEEPGPEMATFGADLVGFAVMLAAAIAVARDFNTGTTGLLHTLTPARVRHLGARSTGLGMLALMAVGMVMLTGGVASLTLGPPDANALDAVVRAVAATFLAAWAGAGVGALTRSAAAATFAVIALYVLLPVALMILGASGAGWAAGLPESTLGLLSTRAASLGVENWAAVGGLAAWSAVLSTAGAIRESKGQ